MSTKQPQQQTVKKCSTDATKPATARSNSVMQSVSATIVRCGCTPEQQAMFDWHGWHRLGRPAYPCPRPRAVEPLGVVSYWHRNPFKRLTHWLLTKVFRQIVW